LFSLFYVISLSSIAIIYCYYLSLNLLFEKN